MPGGCNNDGAISGPGAEEQVAAASAELFASLGELVQAELHGEHTCQKCQQGLATELTKLLFPSLAPPQSASSPAVVATANFSDYMVLASQARARSTAASRS